MSSHQSTAMDVRTNSFCSSGMHLPNGSYVTFVGNGAVGPGGALGSQPYPGNYSAIWDATYQNFDGTKAMRILNPCTVSELASSQSQCLWFDDPPSSPWKQVDGTPLQRLLVMEPLSSLEALPMVDTSTEIPLTLILKTKGAPRFQLMNTILQNLQLRQSFNRLLIIN